MTYTVAPTEEQVLTLVRAFLVQASGLDARAVLRAQQNRSPPPNTTNYIIFSPTKRDTISWGYETYTSATRTQRRNLQQSVSVDVHGPAGGDTATSIYLGFQDRSLAYMWQISGLSCSPLYADAPYERPFDDEADQVEYVWTIDLQLQINESIVYAEDTANTVQIDTIVFTPTGLADGSVVATETGNQ